jgi:hypothetical protein
LAGLIKKPSLRLCGRRHQVSANARIEEKPCQEHQTSQKQNPLRSPRLNFFVLIRVNLCPCALGNSLHHRWYSWLNTKIAHFESIMQNKANLLNTQMNVSSAITMNYEQLTMNYANKNKPQTTSHDSRTTTHESRSTIHASRFTKLPLYICRERSTNPPFLCKTNPICEKPK